MSQYCKSHCTYSDTRSMIHAVTELNPEDTNACAISDGRRGQMSVTLLVGVYGQIQHRPADLTHKHLSQSTGCVLHRSGPVHKIYPCLFT